MPTNKRPTVPTPALFTLEPEPPKQETPAPSSLPDADQFALEFVYDLTAPFIAYPGWGEEPSFWERHKTRISIDRLAHHLENHKAKVATEYEAMLYLSSASLAAPMRHNWAQVYFYLFSRCMPEQSKVIGHEVSELHSSQEEDLARLRRWIFRTQMNHMKAKRKAAENGEPLQAPEVMEQPKMF